MEIKLKNTTVVEQIARFGYFAEQFPDCFSSEQFAYYLDALLPLVPIGKNQ